MSSVSRPGSSEKDLNEAPWIRFQEVSKSFGSVQANQNLNFSVQKGVIHGIIGENGAGKSTAMKMLYGLFPPTQGTIWVRGQKVHFRSPQDAIREGIGMVHQHFMLASPLSVLDNIILGSEPLSTKWGGRISQALGWLDRKKAEQDLLALSGKYGLEVPLHSKIEEIPVGVQQRVEILKTLYRRASILILDEPTAVLTPPEVQFLFKNLKRLKEEGKTVLIITHKLKEVMELTDQITVFRAGRVVGEVKTSETQIPELAQMMVGREVEFSLEIKKQKPGDVLLELEHLYAKKIKSDQLSGKKYKTMANEASTESLKNIQLQVRSGEIVGIAGVEGNGQSELIQAILHPADPQCRSDGKVKFLGKDVTHFSTRRILSMGVGLIPEDRHQQGLLLNRPVIENFILGQQSHYSWYGWMNPRWMRVAMERASENFDIRPRDATLPIRGLSGGNQQKVIVAREFEKSPRLLIAAQPTRGVDIGAIELIHQRILQARANGMGVLLISSELDEILALSDRILVMYSGKIVAEVSREDADLQKIGAWMGGQSA